MLRIRFLRVGKKNRPSFRLVVTPRRSAPKTGKFLEVLGFYDPIKHTKEFKKDRIQYWLSMGASASDSVRNMLISEKVIEGEKIAVHKKPRPKADQPASPSESEAGPSSKKPEAETKEVPTEEATEEPKEEEKTTDGEKKAAPKGGELRPAPGGAGPRPDESGRDEKGKEEDK